MEKVKIRFLVICAVFAFVSVSCSKSDDLDNNPNKITRVQDGNGKVFLEEGKLVDANLNYTQEQLVNALNSYEWEREYCFYYDNHKVSEKTDIHGLPTKIHKDGTLDNLLNTIFDEWTYSVSGKQVIAERKYNYASSYSGILTRTYTVIAIDLSKNSGRIIMEEKREDEIPEFDLNSLYARMVYKAIIP